MKKFGILTALLLILPFVLSFAVLNGLDKKIDREIKEEFEVTDYSHEGVEVSKELHQKLPSRVSKDNFFRLKNNGELLGYAYLDRAPSKTAEFDYLVIFDKDLAIARTKVLVYREEYGGEIGSRRWLRQFTGKSKASELDHIAAISGATISVRSMKNAVKDILVSVEILQKNNAL
ncbi:Na+-translocating ferredoxin:NAD+ oxidoreductase RNF, RnfG subunit [Salinimicrobium catena]|uniref:Na+-translocating ferredoxin:NAD+ oxidoreductase RNF, RnfG subunit n=1 Tax=Salinimicrobium catena TaxID=390640 RepID=A0A1H5PAT5_9FLAO|nr:FMN-binding protein [Salinimicrobium catena]SDL77325.1 Na+-translocating ferredoxin:NAD+ oxidoreductase RNF, RnfG subunit [Salinimicrobium catena]SEF11033.1 Na+-translocating ferredoxin:NAD+ oxidoreductase RNF, RnfG subunit [Salinimicrobium catena]